MTEERQPNTELREKAREWWDDAAESLTAGKEWEDTDELVVFVAAAFAASILADTEPDASGRKVFLSLVTRIQEVAAQLSEIHNRFCGENGEPCQVCRLKAEREEKK